MQEKSLLINIFQFHAALFRMFIMNGLGVYPDKDQQRKFSG